MRNRHRYPLTSHTLYRYLRYSVCCLFLLLSGCAASLKPNLCTPRLTLHLLYPSATADTITYLNSVDEPLYLSPALLQCQHIDDVFYIYSMDGSGPTLRLELAPQGQAILLQQTRDHVHGNLAILIDGQLLATPIIQLPIDGNSLLINGINDEVVAKSVVSSMKVQSNIGRYQVSTHQRAQAPVLFQTGMPLQRLKAPASAPTLPNAKATSKENSTITASSAPAASHAKSTSAETPTTLLPVTDAKPETSRRQQQTPTDRYQAHVNLALHKPALLQQTLPKLQAMNPRSYTIQLLATRNYPIAQALLHEPGIKSPLYLYRTWRNGQDWYLVITGEFASLSEARTAVSSTKMTQLYHDAWVKSVRNVHQELSAHAPNTDRPQATSR